MNVCDAVCEWDSCSRAQGRDKIEGLLASCQDNEDRLEAALADLHITDHNKRILRHL